ncbi:MAG: S9 family peptidase [Betaproteobacteria bacterium]
MRQSVCVLVAVAVLGSAPRTASGQTHPVSLQELLAIRQVSAPAIAPDGRAVLYVVRGWEDLAGKDAGRKESRTHVWRVNADGTGQRQLTFGDRGESAPAWSPDGSLISFVSARNAGGPADDGEGPHAQVWLMRADGGEAWRLTDAAESVAAYAWSPDGARIAYMVDDGLPKDVEARHEKRDDERVFEGDFRMAHLWVVDVATRHEEELVHDPHVTIRGEPTWAADNRRIAFAAAPTPLVRDSRSDIYVATIGGGTEKITTNEGPDGSPAWSPDGQTIAYLSVPNTGKPLGDGIPLDPLGNDHLMLYDVASHRTTDASSRDFDLSPGRPHWTADSRRLLFDVGVKTYSDVFSYDVTTRKYARLTNGKVAAIGSVGKAGVGLVVQSSSEPAEIHVMDPAGGAAPKKLTDTNPQARGFALGRTEVVSWKSDGFTIEGVLLEPVNYRAGHHYPLLVVPHGGPTGAYVDGYRVGYGDGGQSWAGEGWAVLYPNPRGSTNYGEAFERANVGDWGGGDYRDIMAGVDAMIARGIADPDKLAILGWSYGGYMTCWAITQTGRFKAAMIGAGLTNLVSMYGTNDSSNYLAAFFGGPPDPKTMALYRARSGFTFVDRVTTPVLILHGGSDERVPIGQPMEFYRALRDRGRTAELVFYPREGHGFREYYHQLDRLERQHAWITRFTLGAGAAGTSHP